MTRRANRVIPRVSDATSIVSVLALLIAVLFAQYLFPVQTSPSSWARRRRHNLNNAKFGPRRRHQRAAFELSPVGYFRFTSHTSGLRSAVASTLSLYHWPRACRPAAILVSLFSSKTGGSCCDGGAPVSPSHRFGQHLYPHPGAEFTTALPALARIGCRC